MAMADDALEPIGWLRWLFFSIVVRPLILVVLGLNVRHHERLPDAGPAIVVANHNSHLDTLALLTVFPGRLLGRLRPVAAADYFLRTPLMAWFSRRVLGIVPVDREDRQRPLDDRLAEVYRALDCGRILILFPEGSRGEPERLTRFKHGVAIISARYPAAPVVPIFLHGMGKALPRGEGMLVPFFCDVVVGEPMAAAAVGEADAFVNRLEARIHDLAAELERPEWE